MIHCFECDRNAVKITLPSWFVIQGTAYIDKCIYPTMMALWDEEYETYSCCCGHKETSPSIIIPRNPTEDQLKAYLRILTGNYPKPWSIFCWKKMKDGKDKLVQVVIMNKIMGGVL